MRTSNVRFAAIVTYQSLLTICMAVRPLRFAPVVVLNSDTTISIVRMRICERNGLLMVLTGGAKPQIQHSTGVRESNC